MDGYISNPKTIEEAAQNAKFQCDNVSSWLYLKDYECAMIKAECLMDAMKDLLKMINETKEETPRRRS